MKFFVKTPKVHNIQFHQIKTFVWTPHLSQKLELDSSQCEVIHQNTKTSKHTIPPNQIKFVWTPDLSQNWKWTRIEGTLHQKTKIYKSTKSNSFWGMNQCLPKWRGQLSSLVPNVKCNGIPMWKITHKDCIQNYTTKVCKKYTTEATWSAKKQNSRKAKLCCSWYRVNALGIEAKRKNLCQVGSLFQFCISLMGFEWEKN